jgi:phospholipid/cholesterol/gamma-HCH transport system permease protein
VIGATVLTPGLRMLRMLAWIGRWFRLRLQFLLSLMALAFGVLFEAVMIRSWRRPARMELRRILRQTIVGSLPATIFVAAILGLGMVYQALYWLRVAGQEGSVGTILVTVLLREVLPLLVGVILLGRSGSIILIELGHLLQSRQLHALQRAGIDPFSFLILPRGIAFALASYTLGIIFVLVTLLVGYTAAALLGVVQVSVWAFLDEVLRATGPRDFIIFPAKLLFIGLMIAMATALTALSAGPDEDIGPLTARGFVRGMLAVMLTSGFISLAA